MQSDNCQHNVPQWRLVNFCLVINMTFIFYFSLDVRILLSNADNNSKL